MQRPLVHLITGIKSRLTWCGLERDAETVEITIAPRAVTCPLCEKAMSDAGVAK